jgi:hypothetical protein
MTKSQSARKVRVTAGAYVENDGEIHSEEEDLA